jgi:AcrR family transcriptional regulator
MPDRTDSPTSPEQIPTSGWQARKSAATRLLILEATLRCFDKLGYFHATTPAIAEEAGLSRGAVLHHFPTRMDIVRAAVEHLYAKRLKAFRAAVEGLPAGENRAHAALWAHWGQLRHPLYAVFIELCVAARTDPELADILAPEEAAFAQRLRETAFEVVPEWRVTRRNFDLGYDLVTCALQGMALNQFRSGGPEPSEEFFQYLKDRVDELAREQPAPCDAAHGARAGSN